MSDTPAKILPFGPAAELLLRVSGPSTARKRRDTLLASPRAQALVRALPAEDLYLMVKEIGLSDAAQLVAMATPRQFQGFIDLGCWRPHPEGAQLDPTELLTWLATSRDGGVESHGVRLSGLDLELIELMLKAGLHVIPIREDDQDPEPPDHEPEDTTFGDWERSDCGAFWLRWRVDPSSAEGAELRTLLRELYSVDAFAASRLLTVTAGELASTLEEDALRFRSGRMEDMGFPPPEVAAALYRHVDPGAPIPPQPQAPDQTPGFFLAELRGESLLAQAARLVEAVAERARLDRALYYLTNTALVADRADPGDPDQVHDVAARVRAYLNLGLQRLSGGDPEVAAGALRGGSLQRIFQIGFSLTLELRWRRDRLLKRFGLEAETCAQLLEAPEGDLFRSLGRRRPLFPLALDAAQREGWPHQVEAAEAARLAPRGAELAGARPFASPEDLVAAGLALSRAERLLELAEAQGLLHVEAPRPYPLPELALTAAFQALAGEEALPRALSDAQLKRAIAAAFDSSGAPHPRLAAGLVAVLGGDDSERAGLARWIAARAIWRLGEELGAVVAGGDPVEAHLVEVVRTEASEAAI